MKKRHDNKVLWFAVVCWISFSVVPSHEMILCLCDCGHRALELARPGVTAEHDHCPHQACDGEEMGSRLAEAEREGTLSSHDCATHSEPAHNGRGTPVGNSSDARRDTESHHVIAVAAIDREVSVPSPVLRLVTAARPDCPYPGLREIRSVVLLI